MTGVCGAFITGDIFNLYVWFEVLLISSYGLLVLGNDRIQLDGAVKYGVLNLIGTNLFLIATGLLYGIFGTLNMADLAQKVAALDNPASGTLATVAALYFLAFAMKAAAFPVNFWLPASYHTPNIVVSAVFAGLLTKVGVYALIRIFVLILPASRGYMADVIALVAIATLLTGALGALAQSEVRRLLGYLVIAGIGSMLAGVAVGSTLAVSGAIFYAVHSIIVMTALYLAAGIMNLMAGSYDLRKLGGLYQKSAAFAGVFLVLGFAVSGLPPFSGFWPKGDPGRRGLPGRAGLARRVHPGQWLPDDPCHGPGLDLRLLAWRPRGHARRPVGRGGHGQWRAIVRQCGVAAARDPHGARDLFRPSAGMDAGTVHAGRIRCGRAARLSAFGLWR